MDRSTLARWWLPSGTTKAGKRWLQNSWEKSETGSSNHEPKNTKHIEYSAEHSIEQHVQPRQGSAEGTESIRLSAALDRGSACLPPLCSTRHAIQFCGGTLSRR